MKYDTVVTGDIQENCYIAWDEATLKGIIIDPGDDVDKISRRVKKLKVEVIGIYNTHGHFDHTGAVAPLVDIFNVPFALHQGDAKLVSALKDQGALFGIRLHLKSPSVDVWLEDNATIQVGNSVGKVLHTPGHSAGGVCFLFDQLAFVGDTLFAGSVGRTDLPGGNGAQLVKSIQSKLMTLDDNVIVLCGHGPPTTIGQERKYNPFINNAGFF